MYRRWFVWNILHFCHRSPVLVHTKKHFHGVTKIEDAQELWGKLQGKFQEKKFEEEEYEDSHGNVLSRAAYEDLARQGLL